MKWPLLPRGPVLMSPIGISAYPPPVLGLSLQLSLLRHPTETSSAWVHY
jgi:hypothetical protein